MWLVFPLFLSRAQRLTDQQLVKAMVLSYYIQSTVLMTIFYVMNPLVGWWPSFITATMQPVSRLPVFLMVRRGGRRGGSSSSSNNSSSSSISGIIIPAIDPCCM